MRQVAIWAGEKQSQKINARSGLKNPLHKIPSTLRDSLGVHGLDISIQVLNSQRSRSRSGLTTSNLVLSQINHDKALTAWLG